MPVVLAVFFWIVFGNVKSLSGALISIRFLIFLRGTQIGFRYNFIGACNHEKNFLYSRLTIC